MVKTNPAGIRFKSAQKDDRSGHAFTYARKELGRIHAGFKGALERAGIENFRFRDLRHTFARPLVMRGASMKEVEEPLGHKNLTMRMGDAHIGERNKKKAVDLLNGLALSKGDVTKVSLIQKAVSISL